MPNRMISRRILQLTALFFLPAVPLLGQQQESLLIAPGDLLGVYIFDTPELEQHVRVNDAGMVPLLLVGDVKLAGLTVAEADRAIEQKMIAGKYMVHPQVSIRVEQYMTQNVSVLGQVKNPGAYSIATPRSVLDVLTLAGGLTDLADRQIMIQRHSDPSKKTQYFLSNNSNDALEKQVLVYPGDTVLVPKAGIVYVLGDVGHPGGYPMATNDSTITVLKAVALADGTNKTALISGMRLIRKDANGNAQDIPLQFSDIQKGKSPDLALKPEDIVYVPSSHMKNVAINATGIMAAAASAAVFAF
jgi:polysaccharide biosynthesis/export protein